MADIRIDTSNLTYTQFVIPDVISQPIEGANAPAISLNPGSYGFQQISGAVANFRFQVTPEGLIDYDTTYDGFLSGRGSNTLTIRGFTITLDATALSHDLLLSSLVSGSRDNLLTRDRTHELTLVPMDGYNFSSASGVVADFQFAVTVTGEVVIDTQLYGSFASADGRLLIIRGHQITIDAQQLSHDLVAMVFSSTNVSLPRDHTHDLTYIPATGYGFLPTAGVVADFQFAVAVTGEVVIDTQRYGGFASVDGRLLVIRGYQITIDGRQLSHDLTPAINSTVNIYFQRDRTHEFTYIPAAGYGFVAAPGLAADFQFAVTVTGEVIINRELYGGFASASGRSLTISGYQVTIDGRQLSYDLLLSLLGNGDTLTRDRTHQITFIPADGYNFQATTEILAYFRFNVTKDGRVTATSRFPDFARTEGLTLVLGATAPNPAPDLLSLSLNEAQQQRFAELKVQHGSNLPIFWEQVRIEFGEQLEKRLQLDGQLASLTINNVPLIRKLYAQAGEAGLSSIMSLVNQGFYQAETWKEMIGTDTPIPSEIVGESDAEKRNNYANFLAAQIRLSYPTAVIAQMVNAEQIALTGSGVPKQNVVAFLQEHQGTLNLGTQPIEKYLSTYNVSITPELKPVVKEVERIQRVYQITPNDEAMYALLKRPGLDSAYAVVHYGREAFIEAFKNEMGGEAIARLTYAKAEQVHNTVLNLAMSYQVARTAPALGSDARGLVVNPAPNTPTPTAANAGDVIAYPTLEGLFGELDYCACEHCRSFLSPAAYLVDLLMFIDADDAKWQWTLSEWKRNHNGALYPFINQDYWQNHRNTWARNKYGVQGWDNLTPEQQQQLPNTEIKPLKVLLSRRPDIQHLPLTCENTNGLVPHIDLVNETLEYFVTHNLKLENYQGYSTDDDATPEELLASPQFVNTTAYEILAGKVDPPPLLPPVFPLPFHQPLENLRRYFDRFEAPLSKVMEALRRNDNLDRSNENEYAWRDILLEELRFSRQEYNLLTDSTRTLQQLFGYPPETSEADVINQLSKAKDFTRRMGITYEEIVTILQTRFINPSSALIPKLERLGVTFATLQALHESEATGQAWLNLLPVPVPDASHYGGNIEAWVKNETIFNQVKRLTTLYDPTRQEDSCSFDTLEFRYINPALLNTPIESIEFVKLIRFIRLWKKLGWTIEQTDKTITALYPANQSLDDGFKSLLLRIGVLKRVMEALSLNPDRDLLPLLACFAPIDTHGVISLYRQMFLSPALLKQAPVFADNGFGGFLSSSSQKLLDQTETLRAAFQLTDVEFSAIAKDLEFNTETPLTLENISSIFRRGWLAHKLKLSVREFLLLIQVTKIDPFTAPDAPNPPILELIKFSDRLRAVSLPTEQALYLIWNQDISGKSAPTESSILQFARTLRTDFATIASEFTRIDDPDGQIARNQMALAYDNETTDFFFGLLNQTLITTVEYNHPQDELEPAIVNAGSQRISYNNLRKQLSFTGVLTEAIRDALKTAAPEAATFREKIDKLFEENQKAIAPFFGRYPELEQLYDAYVTSNATPDEKRANLLANFSPKLQLRRKHQQVLQVISAIASIDSRFANTLLDNQFEVNSGADNAIKKYILHAADPIQPALNDLMAIETEATGFSNGWVGYLEAPETGFYNFRIQTNPETTVIFTLNGKTYEIDSDGELKKPIELVAGTLYPVSLQGTSPQSTVTVRWQTISRGWEVIPSRYLYHEPIISSFRTVYTRFLKCVSLAIALKLTANELAHFARYPDSTQSWLNQVQTTREPNAETPVTLLPAFTGLLEFAQLKSDLADDDEQRLAIIQDPITATQNPDSLLYRFTRWEASSLRTLLGHFSKDTSNLAQIETFCRVYDAFGWVKKMGISVDALIAATTNEPKAETVSNLQSALRARYNEESWLSVLKPINDEMRGLQRNALVTYVLHHLQADPETAHINTADKLFEYFLMDVQMEPCMKTSRIRHALSSVQLFIERSLMNLEPRIAPSVIDSQQWQWKKRYRVWEANRKIFLYPENWLEPELRDSQSPFFKEAMSELLQSDITEERAATALINYLSKLDEVAKLEPCGIHVVENNPEKNTDDIIYVVARTAVANRKYYYRRQESGVSWTPWEQIKLDIEDNPVTPFVWKGRIFLFWLRILKQPTQNQKPPIEAPAGTGLASLTTNQINLDSSPAMDVQIVLCWSEYYNGKWQPTKTSDINHPARLGSFKFQEFDRTNLNLVVYEDSAMLKIWVVWGGSAVLFYIRNTHSLPLNASRGDDVDVRPEIHSDRIKYSSPVRRLVFTGEAELFLGTEITGGQAVQPFLPILQNRSLRRDPFFNHFIVEPRHLLKNSLEAPFFYEDNNHVFYVTTGKSKVTRTFKIIVTDDNVFYGVLDSGKLLWFKDIKQDGSNAPDGSTGWGSRSGAQISDGWQDFKFTFSGGLGIIYAVKPTGELIFYQDILRNGTNSQDGSVGWHPNSGRQIGQGWQGFKFLLSGGDGIIYGVLPTGELLFYKDEQRDGTNAANGSTGWHPNSGRQIGQGWQGFKFLLSGGDGVIYGVLPTGELLFYKDLWRNGTNAANGSTGWHPNSGRQIGQGWQGFKFLLSGGNGIIYGVLPPGELLFYKDEQRDGTNAANGSTGWHPNSSKQISQGWT